MDISRMSSFLSREMEIRVAEDISESNEVPSEDLDAQLRPTCDRSGSEDYFKRIVDHSGGIILTDVFSFLSDPLIVSTEEFPIWSIH